MNARHLIDIAPNALVVLVGVSGSGKSTLARRHFRTTAVLSSDRIREMLADDEADQSVSAAAFEVLHLVARRRLETGRLTVVDATSTTPSARKPLLAIARETGSPAVVVVLDAPLELCRRNNAARPGRRVADDVVIAQHEALAASLPEIGNEGFDRIYILRGEDEIGTAVIRIGASV